MRSLIQGGEMRFLQRVAGIALRVKPSNSVIREGLRVEPLLHIKRSQSFGHLSNRHPIQMPKPSWEIS